MKASATLLRFLAISAITSLPGMAASVSTLTLTSNGTTVTICASGCTYNEPGNGGDLFLPATLSNFGGTNAWMISAVQATATGLGTSGTVQLPNLEEGVDATFGAGNAAAHANVPLVVTFTDVGYTNAFTSGQVNADLNEITSTIAKGSTAGSSVSYQAYYGTGPIGSLTEHLIYTGSSGVPPGPGITPFSGPFLSSVPYTFTLVETLSPNGHKETIESNLSLSAQTPEPGFYGVLALGLAGLAFAVRRSRRA